MLKIMRWSSTVTNVWVKYNGGHPMEVSAAGCNNVSNLVKAVKKEFSPELDRFSPAQLTLHRTPKDAALEPDLPLSNISASDFSAKSPLIVKVPKALSKVALVLQSNATADVKELLLKDLLKSEVKAKEQEVKAKEREVKAKVQEVKAKDRELKAATAKEQEVKAKDRELQAAKDTILKNLEEKLLAVETERDYLKGTLNARNILENYEKKFKDKNLSRAQNWKIHLDRNPALKARLQECGKDIDWDLKAVEIYKHLSLIIHTDTSRLGGGRFLVMIRKNLPVLDVCFIQAISEQIYGDNVTVNAKADDED